MKRKSPIRHHVRQHKRQVSDDKVTVHDYMRGAGDPLPTIAKPNLHQPNQSASNFIVNIKYDKYATETIPIKAPDYVTAIENAMITRRLAVPPFEVEAAKQ